MRLNDRFISQDYYIFNGKLPNDEKFPQANVNMGPSTCETKTSEVEHYFINYWNRNSQLLVCLWRKKTLIKKLETKFNEKNIEINDKSRSLKHIAYTTGVDSVGSIKLNRDCHEAMQSFLPLPLWVRHGHGGSASGPPRRRRRRRCMRMWSAHLETKSRERERERELLAVPTRTMSAASLPPRKTVDRANLGKEAREASEIEKNNLRIMTSRASSLPTSTV